MFLPDLNNHEKHGNIMIAKKILNTVIIKLIDDTCSNKQISPSKMIKNTVIEIENLKDKFCLFEYVKRVLQQN